MSVFTLFFFSITWVSDELIVFTPEGLSLAEDHDVELYDPISVCVQGDLMYFVDRSDAKVKALKRSGEVSLSFGRKGQGPGEWLYPAAIAVVEGRIIVYDGESGAMLRFDLNGKYLSATKAMRGFGALFTDEGLLVQALLDQRLFHFFDYSGRPSAQFGEGWNMSSNANGLFEALSLENRVAFHRGSGTLFAFFVNGKNAVLYRLPQGELIKEIDTPLHRFAAERKNKSMLSEDGSGVFTAQNGKPIKSAASLGDAILVLAQDEHRESVSYLAVFDFEGTMRAIQKTPQHYDRMLEWEDDLFFFDSDSGRLEQMKIRIGAATHVDH